MYAMYACMLSVYLLSARSTVCVYVCVCVCMTSHMCICIIHDEGVRVMSGKFKAEEVEMAPRYVCMHVCHAMYVCYVCMHVCYVVYVCYAMYVCMMHAHIRDVLSIQSEGC